MKSQQKIQEAIQALALDGFLVLGAAADGITWKCPKGHVKTVKSLYDIIRGSRCKRCSAAATDRSFWVTKIEPGTKNDNFEVLEYLGLVDGHSRVRVRNNDNGVEAVMTTTDFRRKHTKLLDAASIRAVLVKNGQRARGRKNPKNAVYRWSDVRNRAAVLGFVPLNLPEEDGVVFDVVSDKWAFLCKCGTTFSPTVNNVMSGITRSCGCVKSQPQKDVAKFMETLGFKVVVNSRSVIPPYEVDVYVPELKLGIEYNGLYWHGERSRPDRKLRARDKWAIAEESGIRLVTIFEDEWLQKETTVKGFLASISGKTKSVIGARKCLLSMEAAADFLNENHLQGAARGRSYTLRHGGAIVAAAVFARPNASRAAKATVGRWELVRYCVAPNVAVAGGMDRLLTRFWEDTPDCAELVSYSDNRWSSGGLYKRLGFSCTSSNPPSYWYLKWHTMGPRQHRYKWRKSAALKAFGGVPGQTEWDIMSGAGYDRIWDCGSRRWSLLRPNLNNKP